MLKPKLERFASADAFLCPICKESLLLTDNRFACANRHSFDLAKFGYLNLAPQAKVSADYDKESFAHRKTVLEAGLYQHILDAVEAALPEQASRILDIGCGEGYYSRHLALAQPQLDLYAFDLSKEAILLAAKEDKSLTVKWFVGDLAQLPLQNQAFQVILDIFSPANYAEFQRVLDQEGLIIKIIPAPDHLKEIRQLAADQLQEADYSNDQIVQLFSQQVELIEHKHLSQTYSLDPSSREALIHMTPLLFHVDKSQIDWKQLGQITIAADMLIGKPKQV